MSFEPRAIHQQLGRECRDGAVRTDIDDDAVLIDATAGDGAPMGEHRAMRLRIAEQRQHIGVAVENAGRGREQGTRASERGLERLRLLARDGRDVVYAIAARRGEHAFERAALPSPIATISLPQRR